jgi:hypothetical protein
MQKRESRIVCERTPRPDGRRHPSADLPVAATVAKGVVVSLSPGFALTRAARRISGKDFEIDTAR